MIWDSGGVGGGIATTATLDTGGGGGDTGNWSRSFESRFSTVQEFVQHGFLSFMMRTVGMMVWLRDSNQEEGGYTK